MSDIFIAMPNFTKSGHMIFGKNANREPNEAQSIIRIPAMDAEGDTVTCTFLTIPQVKRTFEVVLSKPFQMWGAEMGSNEFGVTIGNIPVYTKIKIEKGRQDGLTGQDIVRLALERCKDAKEALETIATLLETHGQHVFGGYKYDKLYYHNSFVIADTTSAFLLETAGKEWAAIQLKEGFYAFSNALTIQEEYDFHSKGLVDFANEKKWIKKGKNFNFAQAYGHKSQTKRHKGILRQKQVQELGEGLAGEFTVEHAIEILSTHNKPEASFNPSKANKTSICMFANGSNPLQTTGSMIAEIRKNFPTTCWLTGTSIPSLSLYKPFFIPGKNIYQGLFREPGSLVNDSLWWQAELFHRMIAVNYKNAKSIFEEEQITLQKQFIDTEEQLLNSDLHDELISQFSTDCLNLHKKKVMEWMFRIKKGLKQGQFSPFYKSYVNKISRGINPYITD